MRCFLSLSALAFIRLVYVFHWPFRVGSAADLFFDTQNTLVCGACYVGSPGIGADVELLFRFIILVESKLNVIALPLE